MVEDADEGSPPRGRRRSVGPRVGTRPVGREL